MTDTFEMKTGDLAPAPVWVLGSPGLDFTGATAFFTMRNKAGKVVINRAPATILDPTARTVSYQWQTGDTDVAGEYFAEITIRYPDNKETTFPGKDRLPILLTERL